MGDGEGDLISVLEDLGLGGRLEQVARNVLLSQIVSRDGRAIAIALEVLRDSSLTWCKVVGCQAMGSCKQLKFGPMPRYRSSNFPCWLSDILAPPSDMTCSGWCGRASPDQPDLPESRHWPPPFPPTPPLLQSNARLPTLPPTPTQASHSTPLISPRNTT